MSQAVRRQSAACGQLQTIKSTKPMNLYLLLTLWTLPLLLAFVLAQRTGPDVLLVGSVTEDVFDDGTVSTGGAVSYAAVVASGLGRRVCVVYSSRPGLAPTAFANHTSYQISTDKTLTFEHSYTFWGKFRFMAMILS